MFEKLDMKTINFTDENIKKIAEIFPNVVSEDENGKVIDFEALKQELSGNIVEGYKERYSLNWPGKREAQLKANAPTTKTLRPCIEDSVNFDTTENLYIEGDNLEVLKILQEGYLNKIKMIYIDPPYNTGNDFIYNDNFTRDSEEELFESGQIDEDGGKLVSNTDSNGRYHSDWISMMYPRLKLARNLLKDDGLIFISIDDNEISNLRKICAEVFGENNYVGELIWKKKYGAGAISKTLINVHEYIVIYSKKPILSLESPLDEDSQQNYKMKDEKFEIRGGYVTQPLESAGKDERPNCRYPIHYNGQEIWPRKNWVWSKERFDKAFDNGLIVINENNGKFGVRFKQYLKDENGVIRLGKPTSISIGPYNQEGTKEIDFLFDGKPFDFPKPTNLIKKLLSFIVNGNSNENSIILDFFSGSGTTAHSVMKLNSENSENRKFIMVQLPEVINEKSEAFKMGYKTIPEIGKERIRRAGKKIVEESGKTDLDIGFRVLKLDSSNMKDVYFNPNEISQNILDHTVDNIKDDRSDLDLLFGVLIDWGVDLTLPIIKETIQGKDCYFVDNDSLCAYFGSDIDEEFIKELAKKEALRFVFKDSSFGNNDDLKDNVSQIFKQLNPSAEIKVI